jgi:hypothetical protein
MTAVQPYHLYPQQLKSITEALKNHLGIPFPIKYVFNSFYFFIINILYQPVVHPVPKKNWDAISTSLY